MSTLTEEKTFQDVLATPLWFPDYSLEVVTFRQASGVTATFLPGLLLEISSGKYIPLATAANAAGILYAPIRSLATVTDFLTAVVLVRGPCLVNYDQLDANGQTLATAVAALKALNVPILTKRQPTIQTVLGA